MKIDAAVFEQETIKSDFEKNKALSLREVDLEPPGRGEVLIRIAAAGVCHSDLSVINGTRPRPVPMVLGHEASGIVEEVGPGVEDLAPGDHGSASSRRAAAPACPVPKGARRCARAPPSTTASAS